MLCSSREAERAVAAVADALVRHGYISDRLLGVDADESMLTRAADRVRGPALFVLCWGSGFRGADARRLEGLFSARKGPQHRMIAVELQGRGPTSAMPQILGALAELTRAQGEPEDDGRYMRDVVTPTSVSAVRRQTLTDSRVQSSRNVPRTVAEPRGISGAALGLDDEPGDTTVFDPHEHAVAAEVPDGRPHGGLIATDPDTGEMLPEPPPSDGVPSMVAEDFPMPGGARFDEAPPVRRRGHSTGRMEMEVVKNRGGDPRAEADDRPLPSASTPIDLGLPEEPWQPPAEAAPVRRGRGSFVRIVLLLIAAAGMASIFVMAVLHATMPRGAAVADREVSERGVPQRSGTKKAAGVTAGADAQPEDVDVPDAQAPSAASTGVATAQTDSGEAHSATGEDAPPTGTEAGEEPAPEDTTGATGAEEPSAAEDSGAEDDGTDDAESGPSATPPAPSDPSGVPPPPNVLPSASQLDAAVATAIDEGRMLMLDQVLALPAASTTMTWDEAADRCKKRKAAGLRGWRLPSKGELVRLRKAKMLTGGTYWSRSVVGGDEVYAYDAGSGRMNVWLKIEPNARALCVRKKPKG